MGIISSISHPHWSALGAAALQARHDMCVSQAQVAQYIGLTVRQYAALESGFVPPEISEALALLDLERLDEVFGWDAGRARSHVENSFTTADEAGTSATTEAAAPDKSTYPHEGWVRLGQAVEKARTALGLTRGALGDAVKASGKSIKRIEEGLVYGDPSTAPAGDYQSERYVLKRLAFLEMALEWEMGEAARILEGSNVSSTS